MRRRINYIPGACLTPAQVAVVLAHWYLVSCFRGLPPAALSAALSLYRFPFTRDGRWTRQAVFGHVSFRRAVPLDTAWFVDPRERALAEAGLRYWAADWTVAVCALADYRAERGLPVGSALPSPAPPEAPAVPALVS
jgi:hypothetical protein